MLMEAAELLGMMESGTPVTVLDVRWELGGRPGRDDYEADHVVGAGFVDLDWDLSAPPGDAGRHPLPAAEGFGASMRRLGVCSSAPVVVYDAASSTSAARCWWLLEYFGHGAVTVLNGGMAAWRAAGAPTESGPAGLTAPGDFQPVPGGLPLLDADGAAALARAGVLLDARPLARYRGDTEPYDPVAGHIPGSMSAPTSENVDHTGRFRSPDELRARFAAIGVNNDATPVGAYCGSGVTAAHEVLALRLAGVGAALYVGSWSEWSRDSARPVATGSEPG
jgi:thiosulfate/3-mercaptopyruvate sulfurtransferase